MFPASQLQISFRRHRGATRVDTRVFWLARVRMGGTRELEDRARGKGAFKMRVKTGTNSVEPALPEEYLPKVTLIHSVV